MRHEIEEREPERDAVLASVLREAYADAPLDSERAQALRHRIRERAEALQDAQSRQLTVEQPQQPKSPHVSGTGPRQPRWLRFRRPVWAVPALLAATVATVLLVESRNRQPASSPSPLPSAAVGFTSAEQALSADVSDAEFVRVVTREDDPAALLAIAVEAATDSPAR